MAAQPNAFGVLSGPVPRRPRPIKSSFREYVQRSITPEQPWDFVFVDFVFVEPETSLTLSPSASLEESMRFLDVPETKPLNLNSVLNAIDALMSPDPDEGEVAATEYAYLAARSVLESTYGRINVRLRSSSVPVPVVMTDDRGGIRIVWRRDAKQVRINFGASPEARSYLYFESPQEHDAEELQPSNLSNRLEWLKTP